MNKKIVIVGVVIVGGGVVTAWTSNPPKAITPVILGGYVVVLLLALLDMFGGPMSDIAGALAILAATYVVVSEYLPIITKLGQLGSGQPVQATPPAPVYPPNQH